MMRWVGLSALAVVNLSALAATEVALERCRAHLDPAVRLQCYDAIPLSPATGSSQVQGVRGPAVAASSGVPVAEPAQTKFGFESRALRPQAPAPVESIESAIEGAFDGWMPRSRFRLVNGQIWEVADGSTAGYRLLSPKVRITRGVSGSFFIAIDGVTQTPRVRRIQ